MSVDVHKRIAKMLGMLEERIEEVLQGLETINTDKKEKGLLNFCIKASKKDNYKILKEEIDVLQEMRYSDVQILETVSITGYFNCINTLSNDFGLRQS